MNYFKSIGLIVITIIAVTPVSGCKSLTTQREATKYSTELKKQSRVSGLSKMDDSAIIKEDKQPIVKIISGEETDGIEDAHARLKQKIAETELQEDSGLGKTVKSLSLRNVPVKLIAEILTDIFEYNVVVSKGAAEINIDVFMQELTLRQAIESIARLNGMWFREDENIITLMTMDEYASEMVVRRNEKSRAFNLRYTNASDIAKIIAAVMGSQIQYADIGEEQTYGHVDTKSDSNSNSAAANEIDLELSDDDKKKLAAKGGVDSGSDAAKLSKKIGKKLPAVMTVFKRNNSILVRSLDSSIINEIKKIVQVLDTPTNQVLLELRIMQITLDDGFESFFQFSHANNRAKNYGVTTNDLGKGALNLGSLADIAGIAETFSIGFTNDWINARLELYAQNNKVNTLATPFLMCANNSKVEFFVGSEVPLRKDVTSKTISDDEGNVVQTYFEIDIENKELGTDIDISSFINEDGTITMTFDADISSAQYGISSITTFNDETGATITLPIDGVEKSTLKSIISGRPGQTMVIGGIIRENVQDFETKVPFIGDVPVLGRLFKKESESTVKTETIILLTPHIIQHPANAAKVGDKFIGKSSSHPIIEAKGRRR